MSGIGKYSHWWRALVLVLITSSASAVPLLDRGNPRGQLPGSNLTAPRLQQPSIDIDEAIAIAERRYNGRAVGARHVGNGVYRVRILQDNGKVRTVTIR